MFLSFAGVKNSLRIKLIGTIKWTGIYAVIYYLCHPAPLTLPLVGACLLFGIVCAVLYNFLFMPLLDRWADKLQKKRSGEVDNEGGGQQ